MVIDAAWSELRKGRWDAARELFERALEGGETPEALEGLSWAAWWRDDGDAVFHARERAFRLYKRRGDAAAAARMATWLAADELDFRGAFTVAGAWLARARRLLEPLDPGPEHGWLAFHEGYVARLSGDTASALELARETSQIGRRLAVPDLEMLGLALEGATLVACARVEEGMRRLDEATATALDGDAAIPMSSAWTFCFLVTACTAVLDYGRAFEWCDRIADFADRYGSRYMLAFCRAEYGEVHLWRGSWAEADAMLEAAVDDFSHSRPAMVGGPLVALAELRRRQGRAEDAARLLERAGQGPGAQLCRARMALDRGDPGEAAELLARILRQVPPDNLLDRAPALALLVRVCALRGDLEPAATAQSELRRIERQVGTALLRACADVADGILAAAAGDHERARPLFEDAVDRFEASGAPFEAAQARIELAATLAQMDRAEAGAREAATALVALGDLGAAVDADRARALAAATEGPETSALAELTPREREVVRLLAEGLTNQGIAERLVLSEHTVHRHVTNILRKLGVPSRTAAAARAARAGALDE